MFASFSSTRSHLFTTTMSPQPCSHACGGDAEILVVQADHRIHHEHAHLRPLDGALGAERGVELEVIFYFSSTP